jgi:hypothetical protein
MGKKDAHDFKTYAAELTDAEKRYVAALAHELPEGHRTHQPSPQGTQRATEPLAYYGTRRPHAGARIDYTCVLYALFTAAPTMAPRGQSLSGAARPAPYRFP